MILYHPELLQVAARRGADITETDERGHNCLFLFMSRVGEPRTALECKALQYLLSMFDDIFARDGLGNDIFTYANGLQEWPNHYEEKEYEQAGLGTSVPSYLY